MKQHNPDYAGVEINIMQVYNGFIVNYKNTTYQQEEVVFHTFQEVLECVAKQLGLLKIGETLKLQQPTDS
jgi:hypothetical protein